MSDTIYWAVRLDNTSHALLLSRFPAIHPNVYAEHMTIVFNPSQEVDDELMKKLGSQTALAVIGHVADNKGQAVVVTGAEKRIGGGVEHITISCANGTRPVYSNQLVSSHWDSVSSLILNGVIARFTKSGWDTGENQDTESN